MYVAGSGITTFRARIKPDFKPLTKLALKWTSVSGGNYQAVDRGATADIYDAEFRLYAKQSEINTFIDAVESNRQNDTHYFTLAGFEETEKIFGADVDYSSISATVLSIAPVAQGSWQAYGTTVRMRALSPAFDGSPSLPTLRCLNVGYTGDAIWTINKYDSYNGTYAYLDHDEDAGRFVGTFVLSDSDMQSMRRYIATQRGSTISIPSIYGVDYPWGPRRGNTYPIDAKILEWEDLGMHGVGHWMLKLTLGEVI